MRTTRYITGFLFVFMGSFLNISPAWCGESLIQTAVSIAPQKYFVEKIGGSHVTVTVMVPPGAEPHTYEPKPREVLALSRAQIYFTVGVPFESAWLPRFRAVNPKLSIVHTEANVPKIPLTHKDLHEQSQAKYPENGTDIHIWLSPPLVKIQAQSILEGLKKIDPAHSSEYQANYNRFASEIDSLDAYLKSLFHGMGNKNSFLVFHPAWSYFANAYGLNEIPIEIAGKEPKPSELVNLIKQAREQEITVVFVQPQFSSRTAKIITDAIHGRMVKADSMSENWADNIRSVADEFKTAVR